MKQFSDVTNTRTPSTQGDQQCEYMKPTKQPQLTTIDQNQLLARLEQHCIGIPKKLTWDEVELRQFLFKWLITKCRTTLELRISTIEHSMGLFDLYLHNKQILGGDEHSLKLIMLTCLFISSKYEEIYPPSVTDFEFVSKYRFDARDILIQELDILKTVKYELNFTLVSDWYYAMTRDNLPAWALIVLPKLTGIYDYEKVAEIINKTVYTEQNPQEWKEDAISLVVGKTITAYKFNY